MNLRELLLTNYTEYTLDFRLDSPNRSELYSTTLELIRNDGIAYTLASGEKYFALLHFFSLDLFNCGNNGKDCAEYILNLLETYKGDANTLISNYEKTCMQQPFLFIYLKAVHYSILGLENPFIDDLRELIDNFEHIKQYIKTIFIEPYYTNTTDSPYTLMLLHAHTEFLNGKESLYLNLFSRYHACYPIQDTAINDNPLSVDVSISQENQPLDTVKPLWDCRFYVSLVEFMQFMFSNDLIIKYCPNCKKYFVTKYNHSTVYCMRTYSNTRSTCQEYASHTRYRKEKKNDPIHTIYVTCYNKLYSRVRKGKIDKDSPLFQTLIDYRDEYMAKYEENPSETLIEEFKKITKEL